jgi:hypothetical protein
MDQKQGSLERMKNMVDKNEKGQSTIEFILTFSFAIGISFLFISQTLNLTIGFLVHYATYMGGRTFLTHDTSSNELSSVLASAGNTAKKSFARYSLSRFDISPTVEIISPERGSSLFSGITAKYERLLTPYKMVGGGKKATYFSEGFLGKEPTRNQCFRLTCTAMGLSSCTEAKDITLFDNGC